MRRQNDCWITRRLLLQGAGGLIASAAIPFTSSAVQRTAGDITGRVARYMVEARTQTLPPNVMRDAKHRILDTIGAMVSGARLKPGEMAIRFVKGQGGVAEASVLTTDIKT